MMSRSPNMVMPRDPDANFNFFLFCPNFAFNIIKSHKISSGKALYFTSYHWVWKTTPLSAIRVK